ncbi:MAG: hypothetical protein KAI73_03165 [Rhodospirillaceae bacterium]|nr:hypothetical protein [Rhodospirillaceae bacterium]
MTISLVLDVVIAVLLVFTIAYAVRLNHRLVQLRRDKSELAKLAKTFAQATVRAEDSTSHLKVSTEALKAEVQKAEVLKDDLAYLVERGGVTADEMLEQVRATNVSTATPAPAQELGQPDLGPRNLAKTGRGKPDFGKRDFASPDQNPGLEDFGLAPAFSTETFDDVPPARSPQPAMVQRALAGASSDHDHEADAERVLMKVLGAAR